LSENSFNIAYILGIRF